MGRHRKRRELPLPLDNDSYWTGYLDALIPMWTGLIMMIALHSRPGFWD